MNNEYKNIVGIDMGGTNLRAGMVCNGVMNEFFSQRIRAHESMEGVLEQLFCIIDKVMSNAADGIGIGVPGLVDAEEKMVYDVINIPSWNKISLQKIVEEKYKLPVLVENDANCFALGEFYFGEGRGCRSIIGLTIGTGLGSGIIINEKLYAGKHGGAGEFGMIQYLDKNFEYYASGQFFKNVYNADGYRVFEQAAKGDADALKMYEEMGYHLGNAIQLMLYALDVEMVVLGGSVRQAFAYFKEAMWKQINTLAFQKAAQNLMVKVSSSENSGIIGAAALHINKNI